MKTIGNNHHKPKAFGRVAVLMGGSSSEREISLITGQYALDALKDAGVDAVGIDVNDETILSVLQQSSFDCAFIALHGPGGEDGRIQAVLETLNIAYTGSGVAASCLAMDKWLAKQMWRADQLPTPPAELLHEGFDPQAVVKRLGLPLAVKAVHEGSTIGIYRVDTVEDLPEAFQKAKHYDMKVMAESWITGEEFTVGIVGEDVLPSIKIVPAEKFYDFHAKYEANDTQYLLPSGLDKDEEAKLQALAFEAYRALDCTGWGRVDFIRDAQGKFWLLEVNTVPGLTTHSLIPKAVDYLGYSFNDLVLAILASALDRRALWQACA